MPEWTGDGVGTQAQTQRDALVLEHVALLNHVVGRMSFEIPGGLDRDDLYGFGMLGLIAAADSWEPERGVQFSTYAYTRIRGAILDEIRRQDFLPRGRRERLREVDGAITKFQQDNGYAPTPEEIATELETDVEEIDQVLTSAATVNSISMDEGTGEALRQLLSDPRSSDPVGSAEWEELKLKLVDAITDLPEQEKSVITLYYAEELLLKEIGEVLGVTESRVSQIHTRALYLLNRSLSATLGGGLD